MQQRLADKGQLERFVSSDYDQRLLRSVFAGLFSLDGEFSFVNLDNGEAVRKEEEEEGGELTDFRLILPERAPLPPPVLLPLPTRITFMHPTPSPSMCILSFFCLCAHNQQNKTSAPLA